MAKFYYTLLIITGAIMLGGCQTMQQFSIDYMQPADISFPTSLKRIAVVNNMPDYSADDSMVHDDKSANYKGNAVITAESLAEAIAHESYFDEVVICDSALRNRESTPKALSQTEVRKLVNDLNVDFLIALEDVKIETTRKMAFLEDWGCFYGVIDAKVSPTLRIYVPNREVPLATIIPTDSIFWEETGYSETMVNSLLVDEKTMIEQASTFAGHIPVKHLLPNWKTAKRYLFCGGSVNMRDATVYAQEKNWKKAIQLWEKQYEAQKGKKKMQAAFNIALGYEMQDSIPTALEWAMKAQSIAKELDLSDKDNGQKDDPNRYQNYIFTSLYVNELQERHDKLNTLNTQMARFATE